VTYQGIQAACNHAGLSIIGAFHPTKTDNAPTNCKSLMLLGPLEPGFWPRLTASPEFANPDPVDQWSMRVVGQLATELNATPIFPFGGPPFQPFVSWALRSGRVWQSPVSLMVHEVAGLFLSFRGALAFTETIELPENPKASPCEACKEKPCLTACPADALNANGYDLDVCHHWLDGNSGKPCMTGGCMVRRACPISQSYGRLQVQSAHHMRAFHKG